MLNQLFPASYNGHKLYQQSHVISSHLTKMLQFIDRPNLRHIYLTVKLYKTWMEIIREESLVMERDELVELFGSISINLARRLVRWWIGLAFLQLCLLSFCLMIVMIRMYISKLVAENEL